MYVVVETDPDTRESQVLYPQGSSLQIHATLAAAERHRDWYIDRVYVEDTALGNQAVRIYRLKPAGVDLPSLFELPLIRRV